MNYSTLLKRKKINEKKKRVDKETQSVPKEVGKFCVVTFHVSKACKENDAD